MRDFVLYRIRCESPQKIGIVLCGESTDFTITHHERQRQKRDTGDDADASQVAALNVFACLFDVICCLIGFAA